LRAHGGLLDEELTALGLRPDDVLDVSVNVNPYGPCAAVVETVRFLLPVRDGASTRARLLARHRILVRDCTSFGLPGFIRVCAPPPAREGRLLAALREEIEP
jgi:histidinol-phosphate/aromatic aminotransferase/cobyric acid decarboxylase-like protein